MTSERVIRWYDRLQFEIGVTWKLLPSNIGFREWLFSPCAGLTYPGMKITSRAQFPSEIKPYFADKDMRAQFFWLHGALRIVGVDLGAAVFYRQKNARTADA